MNLKCKFYNKNMNIDVLGRRVCHRVHLNENEVSRAVTLIEKGYSRRRVAKIINASGAAINGAWHRYLMYDIVRKRPYPQRQRATTAREDRLLRMLAIRERTNTARTLQNQLVATTGTRISDQTVCNRLHEYQLRAKKPVRVPRLIAAHRKARRIFGKEHRQ